ncbi:MAG: helix-turn-helix transcriptional regulator [Candidatus Berkiella sp.]
MNLPFSNNHISYSAQAKVKEILSPLTKMANIHYFNYSVTYPDNSSFTLHTNDTFFESWFLNDFTMWELHLSSGNYFWNSVDKAKTEFANNLGIGNGIFIVNRLSDRTEVAAFATHPDNSDINTFYLNHPNLFKRFIKHFVHTATPLIELANQERFILPKTNTLNLFTQTIHLCAEDKLLFDTPFELLSKREFTCYLLLIKGYSLEQIASQLNLALPTIANYIARTKIKLNCKTKHELFQLGEYFDLIEYVTNCTCLI